MSFALIDAGPIIAYYNSGDKWHKKVTEFLESFTGQFVTTCAIVTESMYMLSSSTLVQNELLCDLSKSLYRVEPLQIVDYSRIAELNLKYADIEADFADLSLIAISERLNIKDIASLDSDFDIYRRFRKGIFNQVLSSR